MTQKDYNLLASQQYDTTYNAAMEVEQEKNLLEQKAKKLAERTQEKLNRIGTYKQDVLLGMLDADTVTTKNVGYAREVDPYGNRYDAVELRHGDNPYDMQGISKEARDAGQFGKSTYAMQKQKELVSSVFGKPVDQVTEQDMIDVGNQQQIQKLADLARSPGEERWEAPLIINAVQTNLTGKYEDEFGNKVDIPLNVDVLSQNVGHIGDRGGIALGNLYGEEVSANAALDESQNAFANKASTETDIPVDYSQIAQQINKAADLDKSTGFIDEVSTLPGAVASGFTKGVLGTADFVTDLAGRGLNATVGTDFKGGAIGRENVDRASDVVGSALGYDASQDEASAQKAQESFGKAFEDVELLKPSTWHNVMNVDDLKEIGSGALEYAKNPSLAAQSIGQMLPGGVLKKGAEKITEKSIEKFGTEALKSTTKESAEASAKIAALKAADNLDPVAKAKEIAELEGKVSKLNTIGNAVSASIPAVTYAASITNDQMGEFVKNNNGEEMSNARVLGTMVANTLAFALPEIATTKIALGLNKEVNKKLQETIGGGVKQAAARLAMGGVVELPQETVEAIVETVNTKWGTADYENKTMVELVNDSTAEVLGQGIGGAVGGVHMATPKALGDISSKLDATRLTTTVSGLINKVKPEGGVSTSAKEPEYELNDMEAEELYNVADEVFAKHDSKEGTVADRIKSLRELEEKAYRINDNNENKKLLLESIAGVKSDISKEIEGLEDVQEYSKLLGSKESFLDTLDDVMEANEYKVEGKLEENLRAIAQTFGITDEAFQKIKKDYETVDVEATKSSKGYLTQGKALRSILDTVNPDTEKATKLVDQMKRYESSQAKWLKTYDKAKAELEAEVASYNASVKKGLADFDKKPVQKVVKVSANSKIAINVEPLEDGTYRVNEGGYAQVYEAKKRNIEGIRNEFNKSKEFFKKAGLAQETTGVQTKPIIDTEVSSGKLKKAIAQVKKDFDKHGVTAIISTKNDDGRNKLVVSGNEQITNKGKYTKEDVVSVLVGNITTQKDFDAFLKEARSKNSKLRKEISAAQEAGATIVIDTGLAKYPSKKPKVFDYVDTAGVTTKKSVREVLVNQLTSFGPVKYESVFGARVFKSKEDMAKVKAENKEKADKVKTKEEILAAKVKEYATTGVVNYDEKIQEYFKPENDGEAKLKVYLNNRLDKEAAEYADLLIESEEEITQKSNLKESANTIVNAEEVETVSAKIKKLNASIKDKVARLKELSYVKDRADDLIKDMVKKKAATKDFLTRYKAAKAISEESAQELIMNESEEGVVKDILERSYTKGVENFTVNGITYIPDLSNVVNTGNTVFDIVEVVDMFDSVVTREGKEISSDKYISRARSFVEKSITKYYSKKDGKTDDKITMKDSPAYGLLFDAKGNVNDTVVLALKLAMDEYVSYKGSTLSPIYKSKEDVAQMLGVLESQVGKNQYELLKDKGMFKKTVDNEVGKAVLKKLGLSKKKSVEDEVYTRLAAELGQIAGLIAEHDGVIEYNEVETSEYQNAITQDSGERFPTSKGSSNIKFMRFTKTAKGKLNTKVIDSVKDVYEAVHDVISEEEAFRKEPSRIPIPKTKRRHVIEQVAKDTVGAKIPTGKQIGISNVDALNNLIDTEYEYNAELIEELRAIDKDVLLGMLGYKTEEELAMLSFNDRDAQVSTNRDIEKNLNELLALDTNTTDRKMYFDWFFSSNGRYMMDSNTINPQTEKQLHRWLVTPTKHKKEYTVDKGVFKSGNKDVTDVVHYAIAQSMGFGVDKKSTAKINDFAKALLGLSAKELAEVREAILVKGEGEYKFGEHAIEVEHLGHFMQGLKFLENAKKGKFESNLSAEFDAVTSGFGLKLLQLPILSGMDKNRLQGIVNGDGKLGTVWYWLNKVGVFKPEQLGAYDSMNDVLDSKGFYTEGANFYDSYQSLAVDAKIDSSKLVPTNTIYKGNPLLNVGAIYKGIESSLPSLNADETVGKALRNLFKDPFMTFNYSAGIKSIRASLSNKMVNDLVAGIVSEKPEYADTTKFLAKYTGIGATTLVQRLRAEPLRNIPAGKGNLEDVLLKTMDISYGSKVQEIMEKNFKPFMDAHKEINSAFKSMFEVFNYKYKAEIAKVPAGELTSDKKLEIIDKLRESFPVIKGPLSANLDEGIHLYRSESVTPNAKDQRQTPAQTYIIKNKEKTSIKTRHMIREFEAAISAGSVVPIHYIDGAVMGQLLGKGSAITAIHDAIIPPLTEAKDTIKKYNENMIKVAKEYSIVGAINDMLNRVELTPEQVKELNEIKTTVPVVGEDGKTTYESVGVANNFNYVKSRFAKLNTNVQEARTELFTDINEGVTVGHMAGLPGSMWSNKEIAVAAGGDLYTQKEFGVSGETIMEIDTANTKFLKDNPNIKVVEGDAFLYLADTITLDKDATFEDRVVYLAHEIVHAKTKEWLEDNKHTSMVKELTKNIDAVLAKLESKPLKELTDGEIMLRSRLLHDNGQEELRLLENVAVLSAEPAMRAELNKLLPTERVGIVAKILDRIKVWLGKELPIDAAKILKLVDGIVMKAETYPKDDILSKTALDAIPDEGC